jgi:transposase
MARYAAPDGWILQTYRYALDPTPRQEQQLRSHAGASRFAWNWGLARCQQRYAAERKWYSGVDLHRLWNAAKRADPALSWWGENSKCVYQEAFRDLDRALRDYIRSKKGERKGRRLGFPKVKKRAKCRDSFRFSTGVMRCTASAVTLPRLGTVATHELATRYETVVAEDLNVTGMLASRSLARAVADQGFGAVRRMLGYKTTWSGGQLIVADRWYPSSKTCSRCGWRKPSLTLKERVFCCQACGLVLDRDVNAAINLLKLAPGTASGAGTGPGDGAYACGAQVRPADGRLRALSQEPGVPNGNKTGTAAGQPAAAGACAH